MWGAHPISFPAVSRMAGENAEGKIHHKPVNQDGRIVVAGPNLLLIGEKPSARFIFDLSEKEVS